MSSRITDRRQARRCCRLEDHGVMAVRIRPGHHALVVDLSAGGALIETAHRLLPGTVVELLMETSNDRTVVRGRVLRCSVACVRPSAMSYRGAIGFDRALAWHAPHGVAEPRLPIGGKRPETGFRADATPEAV
jgi:hypothetical protein